MAITRDLRAVHHIDWVRVGIVGSTLMGWAIVTNVTVNLKFAAPADRFPFLGVAVWVALLLVAPLRKPEWILIPEAIKGSIFLLAPVACASMMPVETLPSPSWPATLIQGFISAIFDNIPLTALALEQGGYDWGFLAYAVVFGGSMLWFGSSAGVAVAKLLPEVKSVGEWLRHGWLIHVGHVAAFLVMLTVPSWHPHEKHRDNLTAPAYSQRLLSPGHAH